MPCLLQTLKLLRDRKGKRVVNNVQSERKNCSGDVATLERQRHKWNVNNVQSDC